MMAAMDREQRQADRIEAVARVSLLREDAEALDIVDLQVSLRAAIVRIPDPLTRGMLLDWITPMGAAHRDSWVDCSDSETALVFATIVLADLVSESGPRRYGNSSRLIRDALSLWVIPSLAEGLAGAVDSRATWSVEYALDPEGDSIADIAGCLEAEMGHHLSTHGAIETNRLDDGSYTIGLQEGYRTSIWIYWEKVLAWLHKQEVTNEDLATYAVENLEYEVGSMWKTPGITTFDYGPGEIEDQLDWTWLLEMARDLCPVDGDTVKMAMYSEWFKDSLKEACVNDVDLAGVSPSIYSYSDCGDSCLRLVFDQPQIETFWAVWCEDQERETSGSLLVDMEIPKDVDIY